MHKLDPTQQRILGVLIEKELSVPDSYPMTENALQAGCNQKSNRDPEMALEMFEIQGALLALREQSWATRVEGGGRATKYRHRVDAALGLDAKAKAVIAELLLRGPQAPGALKPRVARMGFHASPDDVRDVLEQLAAATPPIVELLPRQPRERDARWAHRLGDRVDARETQDPGDDPAPATQAPRSRPGDDGLAARVARLEDQVSALRRDLDALRG